MFECISYCRCAVDGSTEPATKAMAFFQWRKFNFFSLVKDVDGGGLAAQLGQDNVITCVCSGRGAVTLGDLHGSVWRVINRHWTVERWPGWDGKVLVS